LATSLALGSAAGAATVQVKAGDATPDAGGCGSKANPCDTIQAGVDNAAPGDVVNVGKGSYAENVVVATPAVRLRGAGTLLGMPLSSCPGAAARTVAGECSSFGTQPECEAGWQLDATDLIPRAASCYWNGEACIPCNPENAETFLCTNSCSPMTPAALTVTADDVAIEKLRVRAPEFVGIAVADANGVTIRGARVEGAGSACIAVEGDRVLVSGSSARACAGEGILVVGADAVLAKNRLTGTDAIALRVRGARSLIERNSATLVSGSCIRVDGDATVAERNRLSLCGGAGIDVRGTAIRVSRNSVRGSARGIDAQCRAIPEVCADAARTSIADCADQGTQIACEATAQLSPNNGVIACFWNGSCGACNLNQAQLGNCVDTCLPELGGRCGSGLVEANKVRETFDDECLIVEGPDDGLEVVRNQASLCSRGGIAIAGQGVRVERNVVTDCGAFSDAFGFQIEGDDHDLLSNVARGCSGDGFHVADGAVGTSLSRNQAIENGGDGFDVEAAIATYIVDSIATHNVGGGFEVSAGATTTTVERSRASGNLLDFCDEGSVTALIQSQFGTTGVPCTPD
jgi:hypothetical protein